MGIGRPGLGASPVAGEVRLGNWITSTTSTNLRPKYASTPASQSHIDLRHIQPSSVSGCPPATAPR